MHRYFLPVFLWLAFVPAGAETLNHKFGPTWSCKMISAELNALYEACLVCERQQKEFDPDRPGDKCVSSARRKMEEVLGQSYGVPTGEEDAVTKLANQQARQREIEKQLRDKAAQEKARSRESDVSGGASRAPAKGAADELARMNSEMAAMEAEQARANQRRDDQDAARLRAEMSRMEADVKSEIRRKSDEVAVAKPPPAIERPAPAPQDEFGPNVVVFAMKNSTNFSIQVLFHSKNRSVAWPGGNRGYVLDNSQVQKFRLLCQPGEKICFGAVATGNTEPTWGAGPDGTEGCSNCCAFCGATSVHSQNLIYTGGNSGSASSGGISAADLLGAAIGIAGAVAGSGGGLSYGPSSRPAASPPRNRESGVSGGR